MAPFFALTIHSSRRTPVQQALHLELRLCVCSIAIINQLGEQLAQHLKLARRNTCEQGVVELPVQRRNLAKPAFALRRESQADAARIRHIPVTRYQAHPRQLSRLRSDENSGAVKSLRRLVHRQPAGSCVLTQMAENLVLRRRDAAGLREVAAHAFQAARKNHEGMEKAAELLIRA